MDSTTPAPFELYPLYDRCVDNVCTLADLYRVTTAYNMSDEERYHSVHSYLAGAFMSSSVFVHYKGKTPHYSRVPFWTK